MSWKDALMPKIQISRYKINRFGNGLRNQAVRNYSYAATGRVQANRRRRWFALYGTGFNLERARKLKVPIILYASLVTLTGCATSAEIESLRAEVAKANAVAARAEARVNRTQRQLAALKEASESPEAAHGWRFLRGHCDNCLGIHNSRNFCTAW